MIKEAASTVVLYEGNGQLTTIRLPKEVQFSSVLAICITYLNSDTKPDQLIGENQYAMMHQFGKPDASFSHVLLSNGVGNFSWLNQNKVGLKLKTPLKIFEQCGEK
jgi:hypothetical protein